MMGFLLGNKRLRGLNQGTQRHLLVPRGMWWYTIRQLSASFSWIAVRATQPKSTTKYKQSNKRRGIIQSVFSREKEKKLRGGMGGAKIS